MNLTGIYGSNGIGSKENIKVYQIPENTSSEAIQKAVQDNNLDEIVVFNRAGTWIVAADELNIENGKFPKAGDMVDFGDIKGKVLVADNEQNEELVAAGLGVAVLAASAFVGQMATTITQKVVQTALASTSIGMATVGGGALVNAKIKGAFTEDDTQLKNMATSVTTVAQPKPQLSSAMVLWLKGTSVTPVAKPKPQPPEKPKTKVKQPPSPQAQSPVRNNRNIYGEETTETEAAQWLQNNPNKASDSQLRSVSDFNADGTVVAPELSQAVNNGAVILNGIHSFMIPGEIAPAQPQPQMQAQAPAQKPSAQEEYYRRKNMERNIENGLVIGEAVGKGLSDWFNSSVR